MIALVRLAWRDLKGGIGGLALLFVCLTIAITGIAGVTSLASAIGQAIDSNSRAMLGGDLVVSVAQRDAFADERAAIDAMGRVSRGVGLRAMAVNSDGDSALVDLNGVDGAWPLAGRFAVETGGSRPKGGEVALAREVVERLRLSPGSIVRVGNARLRVSGIIRDMPVSSGFALAPAAIVDHAGLAATGLIQPGSLTTTRYSIILPAGVDAVEAGRAFQRRFPDGGWRAEDRADAASGTRRFIGRLGQLLLLIALGALGIGGIGVASAVAAFVASRRLTIATLKLLGASPRRVGAMLALEVGALATLAILLGLILGAATPAVVGDLAAGFLPLPPERAPQPGALALSASFGLLVTIAAAWTPLVRAALDRPSPVFRGDSEPPAPLSWRHRLIPFSAALAAAALAISTANDRLFVVGTIAAAIIVAFVFAGLGLAIRRLARRSVPPGGPLVRLGVAALHRPGAATVRLTVALGLGLALLVALGGVGSSLSAEIASTIPRRAPALFLLDIPAAGETRFRALVDRDVAGSELRMVPSLRGQVTALNGRPVAAMHHIPEGAWVLRGDRGLTFAADLPPANKIVAGRWWPRDYRGPPLVSLDVDAARALGLTVGDRMTIAVLGRPIEARIASLREIDWRSLGFNFAIIFAPGPLESAPYTLMATVAPPPGRDTVAFERRLAREFPMVSAIRIRELVERVGTVLAALDGAIRVATALAIAVGVSVLAGSVAASRRARRHDTVLLKLVGATRGEVVLAQLVEFALLSGAVVLAAFAIGALAAWALVEIQFDIAFRPDWWALAALPFVGMIVAIGVALLAALPALLARPAAALRSL